MTASTEEFFEEQREQTRVKTEIVHKYFTVWARILLSHLRQKRNDPSVMYLDLFAGPGTFGEGKPSTPLKVLGKIERDELLMNAVDVVLNEKDEKLFNQLRTAVDSVHSTATRSLTMYQEDAGGQLVTRLAQSFDKPVLTFVDPFGYKGISVDLLKTLLLSWGSEAIVFFNFQRFNQDINILSVAKWVEDLVGVSRAEKLRMELPGQQSGVRERRIIESVEEAFTEAGAKFILRYVLKNEKADRTNHFIFHLSKHKKAHAKMKSIMLNSSTLGGSLGLGFDPKHKDQGTLFGSEYVKDIELPESLLSEYKGAQISLEELVDIHGIGKPYQEPDYRQAILKLLKEKKVKCSLVGRDLREGTLPLDTIIQFPEEENV